MDEVLKIRLLQEIATRFPYSYEQIRFVYDDVQSIDATIKICEAAASGRFAHLESLIARAAGSSPHGVDLLNRWPIEPGPSETKSDVTG